MSKATRIAVLPDCDPAGLKDQAADSRKPPLGAAFCCLDDGLVSLRGDDSGGFLQCLAAGAARCQHRRRRVLVVIVEGQIATDGGTDTP